MEIASFKPGMVHGAPIYGGAEPGFTPTIYLIRPAGRGVPRLKSKVFIGRGWKYHVTWCASADKVELVLVYPRCVHIEHDFDILDDQPTLKIGLVGPLVDDFLVVGNEVAFNFLIEFAPDFLLEVFGVEFPASAYRTDEDSSIRHSRLFRS